MLLTPRVREITTYRDKHVRTALVTRAVWDCVGINKTHPAYLGLGAAPRDDDIAPRRALLSRLLLLRPGETMAFPPSLLLLTKAFLVMTKRPFDR